MNFQIIRIKHYKTVLSFSNFLTFHACLAAAVVIVLFGVFKLKLMAIVQLYVKFNFQQIGNLPTIKSIFTLPFIRATEY